MTRQVVKSEPSIPTTHELSTGEFAALLSWYGSQCDAGDAATFLGSYLQEKALSYTEASLHSFVAYAPTVGFVCRIVMRGATIPAASQRWLANKLTEFEAFQVTPRHSGNDRPVIEKPKVSVQDRMKEQVSKCIGELEGCLDTFILSSCKEAPSPMPVLRQHQIKGPQAQQIINWFKRIRDEYRLAHSATDSDLRAAYSNFNKTELKKLAEYCDQIMTDGLVLVKESLDSRSPRKKKHRLPEQIAKQVRYQSKDDELSLTSLEPTQVVGAMYAWTYHTKTRVLTLHAADDTSGLSFKGTTVVNTNASLCISKKLRKPQEILHEVLSGGKTITKKLMESLSTKPTKYRSRLSEQDIIVRIHK